MLRKHPILAVTLALAAAWGLPPPRPASWSCRLPRA